MSDDLNVKTIRAQKTKTMQVEFTCKWLLFAVKLTSFTRETNTKSRNLQNKTPITFKGTSHLSLNK